MAQAENNGLHNDQWGSQLNLTSTEPAIQKIMSFEYDRYTKATIALFLSDQTACFNQMHPGVTNFIAHSHGMNPDPCLCHTKTIYASQCHIGTALDISSGSYKYSPPHRILGLVQGSIGVAGLWALSSSSLFWAHSNKYEGLDLPGIILTDGIKKNNNGYVDDVNTYAGEMTKDIHTADNVMTRLSTGAQKWANLCNGIAQSTAFHKCIAQILSFTNVKSSLKIDYKIRYVMSLQDSKEATSSIKYLTPDQPNDSLGFHHALDGNQLHELATRVTKIKSMCTTAVSTHLSQREAATMLNSRLSPQTTYIMRLSQFTEKKMSYTRQKNPSHIFTPPRHQLKHSMGTFP